MDRTSKVPQRTYATTLSEQLEQLKGDELLQRFEASRRKLAADPYRPIYHYVSPEGTLNDPNGFCFWQGRYHLFYQAYPLEDTRQHWGHACSDDLVQWKDLPLAIYPNPEDKVSAAALTLRTTALLPCTTAPRRERPSESAGVSVRAVGNDATLRSLDAWQMRSIYD